MTELNIARGGQRWRAALVLAGVALLVGGPMHPSAPSELSLKEQFAVMMDDDAWIPGHSLMVVAAVLLAWGLYEVQRRDAWPNIDRRAIRFAGIALAAYVIETVFHLFSFVDVDRLRDGDFALITNIHIGLAAVLYPISGLAIAWLSVKLFAVWSSPAKVFAAAGIVGGALHAISVPIALIDPHASTDPIFAGAGILTALWTLSMGLVGIRSERLAANLRADENVLVQS